MESEHVYYQIWAFDFKKLKFCHVYIEMIIDTKIVLD